MTGPRDASAITTSLAVFHSVQRPAEGDRRLRLTVWRRMLQSLARSAMTSFRRRLKTNNRSMFTDRRISLAVGHLPLCSSIAMFIDDSLFRDLEVIWSMSMSIVDLYSAKLLMRWYHVNPSVVMMMMMMTSLTHLLWYPQRGDLNIFRNYIKPPCSDCNIAFESDHYVA